MYYLISINSRNGKPYFPCGNKGSMRGHYKSPRYIQRQAEAFARASGADKVYALTEARYTQRVCELSNDSFCNYVACVGVLMVQA